MINLKDIKKSTYFKDLSTQDFNALLRCINARAREYDKNEIIATAGDSTKDIYLIIQGIARETAVTIDGETLIGQDFKKNQIFGLEYTIKDKVYRSTLRSLTPCTVLICDRFRFLTPCENGCKRHLILNSHTNLEFSRLVKDYKNRIIIFSKKKTRAKVLYYLESLARETKSNEFYIPYSRDELALFLGVERTALSAELSKMKQDGLIDFNRNYFKLLK